jgi:hypothetical protein
MTVSKLSKSGLRFRCGVLLAMPIVAISAAPLLQETRRGEPPASWLPVANVVHLLAALYLFAAPIIVQFLWRRHRDRVEAPRIDGNRVLLLMGVGGAAAVAGSALLLVALGGSITRSNVWAVVSFAAAALWCWRFRQLLT